MAIVMQVNGKRVVIDIDGKLFVNGNYTGICQWKSDARRWSDKYGNEIKTYKGKTLEELLALLGY